MTRRDRRLRALGVPPFDEAEYDRLFEESREWYSVGTYGDTGYSETSPENLEKIKQSGWGVHPASESWIESHEGGVWAAMYLSPEDAWAVHQLRRQGRIDDADEIVAKALKAIPDLKVVWYYLDKRHGGTSKERGARFSFDPHEVGEWLEENAENVFSFEDGATETGFAITWQGPRIPPRFLKFDRVRGNPDDAALLKRLRVEFGKEHWNKAGTHFMVNVGALDPLAREVLPDWDEEYYVADADFRVWRDDAGRFVACADVQDVYVPPEYRRRGVMSLLYRALEEKYDARIVPCAVQSDEGKAFWRGGRFKSRP